MFVCGSQGVAMQLLKDFTVVVVVGCQGVAMQVLEGFE